MTTPAGPVTGLAAMPGPKRPSEAPASSSSSLFSKQASQKGTARFWERHGGRDTTVRLEWDSRVTVSLDQDIVAASVRQLGRRVSVTTQPPAERSLR
jgi:hypothetical protein